MGFVRTGLRSAKRLTELNGQFVALRYAGMATNITAEIPEQGTVTQDVVRARVVLFSPNGATGEELGETLVYPQIIARTLREQPNDWHAGVVAEETQRSDASRTVIVLTPPEDGAAAFDRAEAWLDSRGLL